jgi:hypothetical protein
VDSLSSVSEAAASVADSNSTSGTLLGASCFVAPILYSRVASLPTLPPLNYYHSSQLAYFICLKKIEQSLNKIRIRTTLFKLELPSFFLMW